MAWNRIPVIGSQLLVRSFVIRHFFLIVFLFYLCGIRAGYASAAAFNPITVVAAKYMYVACFVCVYA